MKKKYSILTYMIAFVGVLLVSVGSASAFSIVQNKTFGTDGDTPFPLSSTFTQTLTFQQFDTLFGTRALDSINVKYFLENTPGTEGGATGAVDNDGESVAEIDLEMGTSGFIESTDVALTDLGMFGFNLAVSATTTTNFFLQDTTGDTLGEYNNTGDVDHSNFSGPAVSAMDDSFVTSGVWAAYSGTGSYEIDAKGLNVFALASTGDVWGSFGPGLASGFVEITYEYHEVSSVPEPTTIVLLGIGLAGLAGAAARRRFKRARKEEA